MPLNPSRGETGLRGLLIVSKRRSGLVARTQACFGCVHEDSQQSTRDKHIGAQRGARGLAAFAETCLQQQRSAKATARRAAGIAKRRNSHSALSSLSSTNSQELCSEAARALADPALTPSQRQARAALQDTVITCPSRTAADEQ